MSSIYQTHKPAGGGDNLFLKLKDGEQAKIRIFSEPAIYNQEFDGNVTTRYAWVVWNYGEKKAQVFSQGVSVFKQLSDLVEEWGEPTEYDITIKRTGEMLETRYSVTPSPKSIGLSADDKKACAAVDLLSAVNGRWLKDFLEDKDNRDEIVPMPSDDDAPLDLNDIPF
jgi:hypothetical protein